LFDWERNLGQCNALFSSLTPAEKNQIVSIDITRCGAFEFAMSEGLEAYLWKKGEQAMQIYYFGGQPEPEPCVIL